MRSFYSGADNLILGRAYPAGSDDAAHHLNEAVELLHRAGQIDYLPLALLARGTPQDLNEVYRIATRSEMRLHLADYYLASASVAFEHGNSRLAQTYFEHAEMLVNQTAYHRRDAEVAAIRALLLNT